MALIKEVAQKYQVTAYVKTDESCLYAVHQVGSETVEFLTANQLMLLSTASLPFYDNDMNLVKFDGTGVIGVFDDMTSEVLQETSENMEDDYADDSDMSYDYDDEDDYLDSYDDYDTDEEQPYEESDEEVYEDDAYYDYDVLDEDEAEANEETEEAGYVSDDYDDYYGYDDEEDKEASIVAELYSMLTDEQIKTLKRYYLWYSRRLFTNAQKDPSFGLTNAKYLVNKKAALDNLRKRSDGVWKYAGFIDMGRFGLGRCTLEHPVRYLHIAWDTNVSDVETAFFGDSYDVDFEEVINSGNAILFGVKCIADFFEVSKDCIKDLYAAQRTAIRDMSTLYKFYSDGTADEANKSFEKLDMLMKYITLADNKGRLLDSEYVPIMDNALEAFYLQFRQLNLVPPKSLIQSIRNSIVGWEVSKFSGELRDLRATSVKRTLEAVVGRKYDFSNLASTISYKGLVSSHDIYTRVGYMLYALLAFDICGVYAYNADTNKDEGGASRGVKSLYETIMGRRLDKYLESSISSIEDFRTTCIGFAKLMDGKQLGYVLYPNKRMGVAHEIDAFTYLEVTRYTTLEDIETSIKPVDFFVHAYRNTALVEKFDSEKGTELVKFLDFVKEFRNSYRWLNLIKSTYNLEKLSVVQLASIFIDLEEKFTTYYEQYKEFVKAYSIEKIESLKLKYYEIQDKIAEEKRLAEELENQKRLEEELKRKEEVEKDREKSELLDSSLSTLELIDSIADAGNDKLLLIAERIKTDAELLAYLKVLDLSHLSDKYDFPKQILNTVITSNTAPSSKQLYHLSRLFEGATGVAITPTSTALKVNLSDNPDWERKIKHVIETKELLSKIDSKTSNIMLSVLRYGTISERQQKYVDEVIALYDREVAK